MTAPAAPENAPATGLRALWRRRPGRCSPSLWATVIALDRLPWPLGEDALAGIYLVKSLGQRARWQRAREWAGAHRTTRAGRWWLAARLCACYGRFVARLMLVGFRDPEHFRAQVIVKGEERLKAAAGRGVILLGFHLGPPGAAIALRALGHQLTWARGWGDSQGGLRPAWRAFHAAGEMLSLSQDRHALGAVLYEARKILVEGGAVYITADGGKGREAFRVPTRPAPVVVRSGWLALARYSGAAVLPVLTYLEGHRQVVDIREPLPPIGHDPQSLEACRDVLARILEPYVAQHPEQCYSLVFRRGKKHRPKKKRPPRRPPPPPPTPPGPQA